MGTLKEDIKSQATWITKAFQADRLKLDYSIDSFIEIDKFFLKHSVNGQPKRGGRLAKNLGPIIFAIGSYVGETIIKNVPGAKWVTDDSSPEGEMTATVKFRDGTEIWPMQRIMKRFSNGLEDAVYTYGHEVTKDFTKKTFNEAFWKLTSQSDNQKKPWWKFW